MLDIPTSNASLLTRIPKDIVTAALATLPVANDDSPGWATATAHVPELGQVRVHFLWLRLNHRSVTERWSKCMWEPSWAELAQDLRVRPPGRYRPAPASATLAP